MLCEVTLWWGTTAIRGEACANCAVHLSKTQQPERSAGIKKARVILDKSTLSFSTINYLCAGELQWARQIGVGLQLKAVPWSAGGRSRDTGRQEEDRKRHGSFAVAKMKPLQKNQGRTDHILGAMADMLSSLALPSQHWVSKTGIHRVLKIHRWFFTSS